MSRAALSPFSFSTIVLAASAASATPQQQAPEPTQRSNILLVVIDDLGVDNLKRYGLGVPGDYPVTRTINHLADTGVLFRNVYANPLCSPTRATLLTGRYAFRNTVGTLVNPSVSLWPYLPRCETTIPEVLDMAAPGMGHAAIGKWHLTNRNESAALHPSHPNPEWFGPTDAGFGYFAGTMGNLESGSYYDWDRIEHFANQPLPTQTQVFGPTDEVFVTTRCVNDALAFITSQGDPWFVFLALQAVHTPIQVPPEHLRPSDPTLDDDLEASGYVPGARYVHSDDDCGPPASPGYDACQAANDQRRRRIFKSMVEATDLELGRLLTSMDENVRERTTVIVVGDNGSYVLPNPTPPATLQLNGAKRSFLEGGVRVPLIVSGANVTATPGTVVHDLVNTTDLFATVVELTTGTSAASLLPSVTLDSVSLVPYLEGSTASPRGFAYADLFHHCSFAQAMPCSPLASVLPKAHREGFAIRDSRFKYIRHNEHQVGSVCPSGGPGTVPQENLLFDLLNDPGETVDLLVTPPSDPAQQLLAQQAFAQLTSLANLLHASPNHCQCP